MYFEEDVKGYKYYSFKIGDPNKGQKDWLLFDLKWPANSFFEAITLHYFHLTHVMLNDNSKGLEKRRIQYLVPNQSMVEAMYRQVIEYKRIYIKKGYTEHRYKKIGIYNTHNFIDRFPITRFYGDV